MNMPAFTAEASLYKTSGHYRAARQVVTLPVRAIQATAIMVPGEVIEIEGEAPWDPQWGLPWGWGPAGWGGSGSGGGTTPVDEPRGPGGQGGGGPVKEPKMPGACTMEQVQSEWAKPCMDKQAADLRHVPLDMDHIHLLSCGKDKQGQEIMGCCQYSKSGRLACVPLPKPAQRRR